LRLQSFLRNVSDGIPFIIIARRTTASSDFDLTDRRATGSSTLRTTVTSESLRDLSYL
jgi:hypothetical protein